MPLVQTLPQELTEEQVESVCDLLIQFQDVFSRHKYDLGCTDLVQVHIPTGEAKPFAEGLRSHPRAYLDAIDAEIQEMLKADVIETSQSNWNHNLVVVRKKSGDLMICVDSQ